MAKSQNPKPHYPLSRVKKLIKEGKIFIGQMLLKTHGMILVGKSLTLTNAC